MTTNTASTGTRTALSAEVRDRTAERHAAAEHSALMTALVAGRLTAADYALLLAQLRPVYRALDRAAARWRTDEVVGPLFDARLERTEAFAADLAFLQGADLPVTGAAQQYAARIDEVAVDWPAGVAAHHYTRYLGDLSGGQAVAAILQRTLDLDAQRGLTFFQFDLAGPPFKQHYRRVLDAVPWDATQRDRFVAEVDHAFELNLAVFDSLRHLVP